MNTGTSAVIDSELLFLFLQNGSVQCPTCKTIYGEKHGNCPDGVMEYLTVPHSLPGNEGHQTKVIIYHISPGIQGPEHPHPGKRFSCRGFPRVCYIPDNDKGRKVLVQCASLSSYTLFLIALITDFIDAMSDFVKSVWYWYIQLIGSKYRQ